MRRKKKAPAYRGLAEKGEVPFFLDGEFMPPVRAISLAEESLYMADYVVGEEGKVVEVRFDRINLM